MSDWLEEIAKIRAEDEAKRNPEKPESEPNSQERVGEAIRLLKQVEAHNSLRKVQKTLLNGKGIIDIFDTSEQYDRVFALIWQGPVSAARNPSPNSPEELFYILVGARQNKIYVNGKPLKDNTPEALKKALVEASRKPGVTHKKTR